MYLTVKDARFTCPHCGQVVAEAVLTHVQCVFTAAALALHLGTGHTVVLVGEARWVVRCGDDRALRPVRLTVGADKVLRGHGQHEALGGHPVLGGKEVNDGQTMGRVEGALAPVAQPAPARGAVRTRGGTQ